MLRNSPAPLLVLLPVALSACLVLAEPPLVLRGSIPIAGIECVEDAICPQGMECHEEGFCVPGCKAEDCGGLICVTETREGPEVCRESCAVDAHCAETFHCCTNKEQNDGVCFDGECMPDT